MKMKLVRESLNENIQFELSNEVNKVIIDTNNLTGRIHFDLNGWDSIPKALKDIRMWTMGQNDIIGEEVEETLYDSGFEIIYDNMKIDISNSIAIVLFNIKPISD